MWLVAAPRHATSSPVCPASKIALVCSGASMSCGVVRTATSPPPLPLPPPVGAPAAVETWRLSTRCVVRAATADRTALASIDCALTSSAANRGEMRSSARRQSRPRVGCRTICDNEVGEADWTEHAASCTIDWRRASRMENDVT